MPQESQHLFVHIHAKERINLATTLLEKEYRKLFLGLTEKSWQEIDDSITGWVKHPSDFHLSGDDLRDFWDSFAAVMESVKLKHALTMWVTAENVTWSKEKIPIRKIYMTSFLDQLEKMPKLTARRNTPLTEIADLLSDNPMTIAEQKGLIDKHSIDPQQDRYPIVTRGFSKGYKVMDGNRRSLRALIYGQDTIEAWVGNINGEKPTNFWVPINDMLQLVKSFKEAATSNNEQLKQAVGYVLRSRFEASELAKATYQNRLCGQVEFAQELFNLAQ